MTDDLAPIISKARYAKGKMAVRCPSDGSGYKTRAARLCDAVSKSRTWSNREKAYILSPTQAGKVLELYKAEKDAQLGDVDGKLGFTL